MNGPWKQTADHRLRMMNKRVKIKYCFLIEFYFHLKHTINNICQPKSTQTHRPLRKENGLWVSAIGGAKEDMDVICFEHSHEQLNN